jgi:hypothetical protein
MTTKIEVWYNHHFPVDEKTFKDLRSLYTALHNGHIWYCETDSYDAKITITIETDEDDEKLD